MRQIEARRRVLNLSVKDMTQLLNLNERTYRKIETQENYIKESVGYGTLEKLSEILKLEIPELLKNPELSLGSVI